MALSFEQVTGDGDAARNWHAVQERCTPIDHPGLLADPFEETLSLLVGAHAGERHLFFLASEDGLPVACALVSLPTLDNLDNVDVDLSVLPERRRKGIGSQFAQFLLDVSRGEGRSRVICSVASPLDGESPGAPMLRALGAEPANELFRRQLLVDDVTDDGLGELEREGVGAHAAGYEVVRWIDRVPEPLLDGAAVLMGRMVTDAPLGSLAWEPEAWDADRYRNKEDEAIARGRQRVAAGAVDADGRLVAYTDVGVSRSRPTIAYQWDTIVSPKHRGHRLGLLIKIENLRQLRQSSPGTVSLQTWNAASNAHMVAINDALGFRPVERSTHWQLAM